jgi:hypothetical protein
MGLGSSEYFIGAVRWSKDDYTRRRGDTDVHVGGVGRLGRIIALARLAAMECQALPAYLFSAKETQVMKPLSICHIAHATTDVARNPGTISVGRLVGAQSAWVLFEDLILVATMQGFRNSRDPELLHKIGDKSHALNHTHGMLLILSVFVGAVCASALAVVGTIVSVGLDVAL